MPNGYMKGKFARRRHEGPPRVGTINQRAQRFRTRAGLISWCKREGTRAKNEVILKMIPDKYKDANSTKGYRELNRVEVLQVENKGIVPERLRKSRRKTHGEESDDDAGSGKSSGDGSSLTDDEWTLASIETPQESVETGRARPHPTISSRTLPGQASLSANPPSIESPDTSSRMTLRSRRVLLPPATFQDEDPRLSVDTSAYTPVRRTTMHRETGTKSIPPDTATDTPSPLHEEAGTSTAGRKRRHQTDDTAASDEEESGIRARPKISYDTPYLNQYLIRNAWKVPDIAPEDLPNLTKSILQDDNTLPLSDLPQLNLGFDPELDDEFQVETQQGILAGDCRYMAPKDHGWKDVDARTLSRALELTRIQYCDLKGHTVPGDFTDYMYESYASQWRRIQDQFEQIWTPFSKPTTLYRLPKWRGGFNKWKVPKNDKVGNTLMDRLKTGERAIAEMEREFREQDRLEAEEAARKRSEKEEEEE